MASIDLDIAYDDTLEDTLATIPADLEITYRVVNANGPGGGWPVIEFSAADQSSIDRLVREWYSPSDQRDAEYILRQLH